MKKENINVNVSKDSNVVKLGKFINSHMNIILCVIIVGVSMTGIAFAAPDANALWGELSNMITTWVSRLGAVIMFVGGVMFGLGWKSDDAEQKSRGISTMVSGGIVIAMVELVGKFFV